MIAKLSANRGAVLGYSFHRLGLAGEIDAVDVHRVGRGRKDILLPARRDVFFQHIEKHIRVLHVGFAVGREVGHLRGGEI